MKNYQFVLSFLLIFLIISCSKDTVVTPSPTDKVCLIQKIEYNDGFSDVYTYDSLNRISNSIYKQDTMRYEYNGKTVLVTKGGLPYSTIYLNDYGYADSIVMKYGELVEVKTINSFNSFGQLVLKSIKRNLFGQSSIETTSYQYTGGNVTKEFVDFGDGQIISTDYEYYLDKVDETKKSLEEIYFENKNLNLKKRAVVQNGNVVNYNYILAGDGKIIQSSKIISGITNNIVTSYYTWICK